MRNFEPALANAVRQYSLKPSGRGWGVYYYSITAGAPAVTRFKTYEDALESVTRNRVVTVLRILGASERQFKHERDHGVGKRLRGRIHDALAADLGGESGVCETLYVA